VLKHLSVHIYLVTSVYQVLQSTVVVVVVLVVVVVVVVVVIVVVVLVVVVLVVVGFNCFGLFYLLLSFLAPAECGRLQ